MKKYFKQNYIHTGSVVFGETVAIGFRIIFGQTLLFVR